MFAASADAATERIRLIDADLDAGRELAPIQYGEWHQALHEHGAPATLESFRGAQWHDNRTLRFVTGDAVVLWDVDESRVRAIHGADPRATLAVPRMVRTPDIDDWPPSLEVPAPDGEWMLTEAGDDLAIRSLRDDRVRPLTRTGEPGWWWRVDGASWSPASDRVFVIRNDYRAAPPLPVVDYLNDAEQVSFAHPYTKTRYWPIPRTFHLIDVPSGRIRDLDLDTGPGAIVMALGWRGHEVVLHTLDAEALTQSVIAVDACDGAHRIVLTESATISTAIFFRRKVARIAGFRMEAGHDRFFWPSERTGFNHWYVHSLSTGEPLSALTSGEFDAEELVGVAPDGRVLFAAHANPERPFDTQLCAVGAEGGDQQVLTDQPGDHTVDMSPSGRTYLDTWSTVATAPRAVIRDLDGREIADLSPATGTIRDWTEPIEFSVTAADGHTPLHGVLYLPPEFDPGKSYPLVDVIYGGCQVPVRPTRYDQSGGSVTIDGEPPRHGAHAQAIAQIGFVTVVLDGRGTPGRGSTFQETVRGQMGSSEIPDHAAAVRELIARHPWIDGTRVGITGRSWGGYLTVRAMLLEPDLFRVAVAEAPAADLYDHIGHLSYIIMGDPATHEPEYLAASSLRIADRLAGRLLITHGTSDLSASLSGTMKLVNAFIGAGRPVDMFLIPGATHYPKGQAGHYSDAVAARYLVEHLRPQGVGPDDIPFA